MGRCIPLTSHFPRTSVIVIIKWYRELILKPMISAWREAATKESRNPRWCWHSGRTSTFGTLGTVLSKSHSIPIVAGGSQRWLDKPPTCHVQVPKDGWCEMSSLCRLPVWVMQLDLTLDIRGGHPLWVGCHFSSLFSSLRTLLDWMKDFCCRVL